MGFLQGQSSFKPRVTAVTLGQAASPAKGSPACCPVACAPSCSADPQPPLSPWLGLTQPPQPPALPRQPWAAASSKTGSKPGWLLPPGSLPALAHPSHPPAPSPAPPAPAPLASGTEASGHRQALPLQPGAARSVPREGKAALAALCGSRSGPAALAPCPGDRAAVPGQPAQGAHCQAPATSAAARCF